MVSIFKIPGFSPYLAIVFLNIFNVLANSLIIYHKICPGYEAKTQILLTAIVAGLFFLAFILTHPLAGYLSDKYPKNKIIKFLAIVALGLSFLTPLGYYWGGWLTAFTLLFLFFLQAAFFSPAKLGYIRELVGKENIAGANAWGQGITMLAMVFTGTIFSFPFTSGEMPKITAVIASGCLIIFAAGLETVLAFLLPQRGQTNSEILFDRKELFLSPAFNQLLQLIKRNEVVGLSILGLTIFWGITLVMLTVFTIYNPGLGANSHIFWLLALAGGGMAGAWTAGRVSRNYIETGMIPLSAIVITFLFLFFPEVTSSFRRPILFFLYGMMGSRLIVPLNSLIQFNARANELGRILALNNFSKYIAMLLGLIITIFFAFPQINPVFFFRGLFLVALGGSIYAFLKLPQTFIRYLVTWLVSQHYKLRVLGIQNIPSSGGVLLLGNHISYLDWAILQMACPRRIRFVMYRGYYEKWYLKKFLNFFGVVPISSTASKEALETIEGLLNQGEVVALFPEGAVTRNGQLGVFHRGFERAVKNTTAVIIPFYLLGLWGSIYSFATKKYRKSSSTKWVREVFVCFGNPMPREATAAEVKKAVFQLSIYAWQSYTESLNPVAIQWLITVKKFKNNWCLVDFDGTVYSAFRLLVAVIALGEVLKKKIKSQRHIGLLLPPSAGGIITNLSVLMLGKVVVNLNYTATISSLAQAINQGEIDTIITSRRFLARLSAKGFTNSEFFADKNLIYLEDLKKNISFQKRVKFSLLVKALPAFFLRIFYFKKNSLDDTAAILFSSGSEGLPKGVQLTHRNLIANIKQIAMVLNAREDDILMSTLPLFHAFGLTVTTLLPLVEGIPLVCYPDPTNGYEIGKLVAQYQATILCATSTFLRLYNKNKKLNPLMFQSLRLVVAGAEKLSQEVREEFKVKFGKDIYEGYGTTETSPVASFNLPDVLLPGDWSIQKGNKIGTVGLPLPGTAFKIVDPETLAELPPGEAGLILIGGPQVMKGYLKNEKKTQEVILERDGIRWYKTGDKGFLDKDGFLTILDRYSRFAKIGGEMISLGVVEEEVYRILNNKEIELAAVALPDERKGEQVVLLVAGPIDPEIIKPKLIENKLNPIIIPETILGVESIPKLGSGKTDFTKAKELARGLLNLNPGF